MIAFELKVFRIHVHFKAILSETATCGVCDTYASVINVIERVRGVRALV